MSKHGVKIRVAQARANLKVREVQVNRLLEVFNRSVTTKPIERGKAI
jgi:hypothetical protein